MNASALSSAQKRLWLLDLMLPLGSIYNLARVMHLRGALDVDALRCALNDLLERHATLRSHVVLRDGEPLQEFLPRLALDLAIEDLRALPRSERHQEAQRRADEEARIPFELEREPLVRARLLRIDEHEHWLLVTVHHIAADDRSLRVLWRELSIQYDAHRRAAPSPLAPLALQYEDYVRRQRDWLRGELLEKQVGYWKSELAGLQPLELPADRARPSHPTYLGRQHAFALSPELTRSVRELAHSQETSFFTTLLAALQVLLYRHSGQSDVTVGVPVAGRQPDLEELVGLFVNTVVVRADLSQEPTFVQHLASARTRTLQAYENQELPFDLLVEKLNPRRDSTRNPLFQVMLTQWNPEGQTLRLAGLEPADVVTTDTGTAKFDLEFVVAEKHRQCHITVEYATELFDAPTIERMARHFTALLEAIVRDPEQSIGTFPLLTDVERRQLLVDWNDTATPYPAERCAHQLFEDQAAATPEAVAVVFEERQLTYRELNERANRLAHHLISLGVGPEVLVGISVERSLDLIIGLLGILKAGGAYVPLDPAYPKERLAFMLEDTHAPVLLTQERLLTKLPSFAGHIVCLDRDWHLIGNRGSNSDRPVPSQSLAYVIYTSGSTGTPKGVQLVHASFTNLLCAMRGALGCSARDVMLSITTVSFDIAAVEIFLPLIVGARVEFTSREVASDSRLLKQAVMRCRPTMMQATPATWRMLVEADCRGVPGMVAICGGEMLARDLADELLSGGTVLWNGYGPTETTIYSVIQKITSDERRITIGRPIANTRTYILDRHRQPVPIGVVGELYIGGAGVGRGYLDRPELTAERFPANPFPDCEGTRMYRTGDLARYMPDGRIECLGRVDDQVKIRGFRIEPGEIESVLAEHPAVAQAVVLARIDASGDKRLVAYLFPADSSLTNVEPLRAFLRERLPEFLQPAAYVLVDKLPLTPSGKVDRKALARLDAPELPVGTEYVAPRAEQERTIVELWQSLMGRKRIGIHDNFFDLGGHSLLAIKFLLMLQERLGRELPVRLLFESPTPATLAERLSVDGATPASIQPVPTTALVEKSASIEEILQRQRDFVKPWKGKRATPESFIVTLNESASKPGLFWCLQGYRELTQLAAHLGAQQPLHGMRSGHLVMPYTDENVRALACHYAEEMIALQPKGPFVLGGNCQGGIIARAIAVRLRNLGRSISLLILMEQDTFPRHDDPVALIFGRDSHFNPYKADADPEPTFRGAYPAGFTVDIIAGAHGRFFESPNVESLASVVSRRVSGTHARAMRSMSGA